MQTHKTSYLQNPYLSIFINMCNKNKKDFQVFYKHVILEILKIIHAFNELRKIIQNLSRRLNGEKKKLNSLILGYKVAS